VEYGKVKSVAKRITTKGPKLSKIVLETMRTISEIVGATLGPGGRQVTIERFEHAIPPMLTKDGVTVFRSLGFENAEAHCIMECARDAAVRTASEAGDGTTTATVLAEALVRLTNEFCAKHPHQRPQKVVRHLEQVCQKVVVPILQDLSIRVDSTTEDGQKLLRNVAKVSANGDDDLADAVMKCFDLVGDDGNVTIVEVSGSSHYEVEQIDGFPIGMGYEDSCAKFYPKFINDSGRQMSVMEDPVFVLYHGTLTEVQSAFAILSKVGDMYEMLLRGDQKEYRHRNVVFVAVGFSEQVLATFASSWGLADSIKIFPLVIPKSPLANFQTQFLEDLSAITGATIFDPINRPLDTGNLEDLGPGVASFEAQ
jgi:chaperonin GroEL